MLSFTECILCVPFTVANTVNKTFCLRHTASVCCCTVCCLCNISFIHYIAMERGTNILQHLFVSLSSRMCCHESSRARLRHLYVHILFPSNGLMLNSSVVVGLILTPVSAILRNKTTIVRDSIPVAVFLLCTIFLFGSISVHVVTARHAYHVARCTVSRCAYSNCCYTLLIALS